MKEKLTIKELAEFINGRDFAKDEKNGIFISMVCDGEPYGAVCGNGEAILTAMLKMVAQSPGLVSLLADTIANGMYHKGLADAQRAKY
ncbi:MAG: hypothetical protein UH853_06380 [Muribaculaceae bacterium]|nr:hypothetical protein [Muribaculaceae bacterium]